MATWPTTLPVPLLAGYGFSPIDQTIRTDMETGSARVRRRTTARLDRASASWLFDQAQMDAFRTFFDDAAAGLAGGAAWCGMTLDMGDGSLAAYSARFIGPWQAARDGQHWRVTATLEVRNA